MTRYQLAKLIYMAGGMEARKRVQKTVHLLQEAGCQFGAKFRLHYFGPYSSDVAGLLDELVTADVLDESADPVSGGGSKYSYVFNEKFTPSLQKCERMPSTKEAVAALLAHSDLLDKLGKTPLRELELASTIAFFRSTERDWDEAIEKTCDFKRVEKDSRDIQKARQLAEEVVAYRQ